MSEASYIDRAATWTERMVRWESRGWGDDDNARRRLARASGTPYSLWRKLRYERHRVAGIYHDSFERLRGFYAAECARHEAAAARARADVLDMRREADAADTGAGGAPALGGGAGGAPGGAPPVAAVADEGS